ncbi:response regulator [Paenibacillaceae bacterium]|nr:response regulator [Paenibacillaceae bacterium]
MKLKVIILDDERAVREGIDLLIDWDRYGITDRYLVEDGLTALQIIHEEQPAVMFSDMKMPGINGIELLQRLRDEKINTQVIIVSGYDDYQYMKAAIQAKGVDYILKPFRKAELEASLERALSLWRESEKMTYSDIDHNYTIKSAGAILNERKMSAFLKGETPFSKPIADLFPYAKVGSICELLLKNRLDVLKRRFGGDSALLDFAISNIVNDVLKPCGNHILCRLEDDQWVIMDAADSGSGYQAGSDSNFSNSIERVTASLSETIELEVLYGISQSVLPVRDAQILMGEARRSLLECNILKENEVLPALELSEDGKLPLLHEQFVVMSKVLETGSKEDLSQIVKDFVQKIVRTGQVPLRDLQSYTLEANLFLRRSQKQYELKNGERLQSEIPLWISDVSEWEKWFIHQLWAVQEELGRGGHGDLISEIKEYIRAHFNTDLSLTDISNRFYLSPQYISRRFKEIYGCTFIQFITDLRVEKAKSLLMNTSLSILKISELVGYEDETYFSKVFKKHKGISPKQYRKANKDKNMQF